MKQLLIEKDAAQSELQANLFHIKRRFLASIYTRRVELHPTALVTELFFLAVGMLCYKLTS